MESGVEAQTNYLLNHDLIERISKNKLNINGKGRIYNPSKPPIKIFTKVVGSLYKKQFPKEPKPTRRIRKVKEAAANSANVLLKFDKDRRVDKNSFLDFEKDFYDSQKNKDDSQKNKENTQIVELKLRVKIEIIQVDPNTGEKIGDTKIHTTEVFIETQTVYGGDVGLKLYIIQNNAICSSA